MEYSYLYGSLVALSQPPRFKLPYLYVLDTYMLNIIHQYLFHTVSASPSFPNNKKKFEPVYQIKPIVPTRYPVLVEYGNAKASRATSYS